MNNNHRVKIGAVAALSLIMTVAAAAAVSAQNAPWSGNGMQGQGYGPGYGMMGPGYGPGAGYGMMGRGYGPGSGYGMHRDFDEMPGYRGRPQFAPRGFGGPQGQARIEPSQVEPLVESYLKNGTPGDAFDVVEIMQFQYNYYVQVASHKDGSLAFELLVDPYSGRVFPEPGPNMMWNTSYGHMGGYQQANAPAMTISPSRAVEIAAGYVRQYSNGSTVGKAEQFPGYYTLHVLDGGKIVGMLSVNGYTGAVWYHNWHGQFVKMITEKD